MPLPDDEFYRLKKLPPYVFAVTNGMKASLRAAGHDVLDFGMGNPDGPTPPPVVDALIEAARNPANHGYSVSRGITELRDAVCGRYRRLYGVDLDPETEAVVTIGAKEALAHLLLAVVGPGDHVIVPGPAYPIHQWGVVLAEGEPCLLPLESPDQFLERLKDHYKRYAAKPKMILISFPHNPTTQTVELDFMREIVAVAAHHGTMLVHDIAYADVVFDGYQAPSILQVPGAKEVAVEIYSLSKSFNMAGWRVGFCLGNRKLVGALAKIKSYLDYGTFQPIQIAAATAVRECDEYTAKIRAQYQSRRDVLVAGLQEIGWPVETPRGSMFVWAKQPAQFAGLPSLDFAKLLLERALVGVAPGIGFGQQGEGSVRFALIENEERTRRAIESMGALLRS